MSAATQFSVLPIYEVNYNCRSLIAMHIMILSSYIGNSAEQMKNGLKLYENMVLFGLLLLIIYFMFDLKVCYLED